MPLQELQYRYFREQMYYPIREANERLLAQTTLQKYGMHRYHPHDNQQCQPPQKQIPATATSNSEALLLADKFTLILMTYEGSNKDKNVVKTIKTYQQESANYGSLISEIVLVWNGAEHAVPEALTALTVSTKSPRLRVVAFSSNSLLNR